MATEQVAAQFSQSSKIALHPPHAVVYIHYPHRSSSWVYLTEAMPFPLPPSWCLPKLPSEGLPSWLYVSSRLYKRLQRVNVPAVRTQQPCDDNIRSRDRINPLSTHFVSDPAPGIRAHSTEPHLSPFVPPPAPTHSWPPGLWRVVAYG